MPCKIINFYSIWFRRSFLNLITSSIRVLKNGHYILYNVSTSYLYVYDSKPVPLYTPS